MTLSKQDEDTKKLSEKFQKSYGSSDSGSSSSSDSNSDYNFRRTKDKYNLVYLSFFLIGIGMLLPWNFFINADQYFKSKLKGNEKDLKMFESAFSICSQIPCGLALVINLFLTNRVSRSGRVITTLIISTICFVLTTILVNVDTTSWTGRFFAITLTSVAVINFCAGIFQGTIFGIAGAAGGRYIQGAVVGMSTAGTFASVCNIIALAVGDNIKVDSTIYFSIASCVILACIFVYIGMFRLPVLKDTFRTKFTIGDGSVPSSYAEETESQSFMAVFRRIWPTAFSVMCVFCVTITIMPSILSGIQSVNSDNGSAITNKYFTAVVGFLIFNIGDFTGRIISGFVRIVSNNGPWLPIICIARVAFIPLFMLCNFEPRHHLPVVFDHDAYPIIFNILFSVSNGYLASLCMMYGPERAPEGMMETAGATMQLFLTIGLGIGSILSFAVVGAI